MKYKITLNDRTYEVEVEDGKAMLLDEYEAYVPAAPAAPVAAPVAAPAATPAAAPAAAPAVTANGEVVAAPMPGTVLNINVTVGQAVNAGDVLVVLEAMKMENEIFSNVDGKVVAVNATAGSSVNTGDAIVSIG